MFIKCFKLTFRANVNRENIKFQVNPCNVLCSSILAVDSMFFTSIFDSLDCHWLKKWNNLFFRNIFWKKLFCNSIIYAWYCPRTTNYSRWPKNYFNSQFSCKINRKHHQCTKILKEEITMQLLKYDQMRNWKLLAWIFSIFTRNLVGFQNIHVR